MLFNDGIKNHWLEQIRIKGNRFNPDCGNRPPMGLEFDEDFGEAAPFVILTGIHTDIKWSALEKEFQLPSWLLKLLDDHMHDYDPRGSAEFLETMFEVIPTYADMDKLHHKFNVKVLLYTIEHFSDLRAQLSNYYMAPVWANLLTIEKLKIRRAEIPQELLDSVQQGLERFEYWFEPGNKYDSVHRSVERIRNGWTDGLASNLLTMHELHKTGVSRENVFTSVKDMLYSTLKEYTE